MCLFHKIAPSLKAHKRGVAGISETKGASLTASQYARDRRLLAGNDSGTVSVESRYAPWEILSLRLRPDELSAPGGEDGQ